MAIQDSFSLSNALNSQSYAYKCWYNYNYGCNTMGISAKDIGQITQTWNGELDNWKAVALDDENAYEIDDDDFSTAKRNGKQQAENKIQEQTGGNTPNKGGMITRGVVDGAAGLAGGLVVSGVGKGAANAVAGSVVKLVAGKAAGSAAQTIGKGVAEELTKDIVKNATKKMAEGATTKAVSEAATKAATTASEQAAAAGVKGFVGKAASKAASKAAAKATANGAGEKAAQEAGEEAASKVTKAGKNVSFIITAPLALATGTAYSVKKPNKTEKEACDAMQDEMTNSQSALYMAQSDMDSARADIETLSDEAQMATEEANATIEDQQTELMAYRGSYDALIAKKDSGVKLREDEVALLKALAPTMQQLGEGITATQEDTTDVTGDIQDEMGTYQDTYDNAAGTVAEVQGVTDYAASFDSATKTMCYVESGAQGLNAASGTQAAIQAGKFAASGGIFTAWAWGFAAMGAAGAVQSGLGTAQQMQWAGNVGTEIDMRKATQDINTSTNDIYDESIESYEGSRAVVDDLEVFIPDDLEDNIATVTEGAANTATEGESNGAPQSGAGLGGIAGANQTQPGNTPTNGNQTPAGNAPANGNQAPSGNAPRTVNQTPTGNQKPDDKDKEEK